MGNANGNITEWPQTRKTVYGVYLPSRKVKKWSYSRGNVRNVSKKNLDWVSGNVCLGLNWPKSIQTPLNRIDGRSIPCPRQSDCFIEFPSLWTWSKRILRGTKSQREISLIFMDFPNDIFRRIPPEVNGVWLVCFLGPVILNLTRWPWMSTV